MSENIAKYNVLIEILSDAKGANEGVKKLKDETTGLRGIFNLAKGSFAGIIAAEAVQRGIRFIGDLSSKTLSMAGSAEQTAISFNTLIGNAERADQLFRDLDKFSIDTPFEPTEINNAAKTLLGFGRSADIVLADLNLIGNASAATGANLQSLAVVFGQVAGAGKLSGQDALQFINQGIPVYQLLSDSLGKSVKEIKKLQEDGKITFDVLREAFAKASEDGGKFAGALIKQSESFEGLKSTASGARDAVLRTFGEGLLPILKELLPPLINLLFKAVYAFKDFAPILTGFLRGVLSFAERTFGPLVDSIGKFVKNLGIAGNEGKIFNTLVLRPITQTITFLTKVIGGVLDVLGPMIEYFRTSDLPFFKVVREGLGLIFTIFTNIPAIINGSLYAIKQFFTEWVEQQTIAFLYAKAGYNDFLAFFGDEAAGKLADGYRKQIDQIKSSSKSIQDEFKRGFAEIYNNQIKIENLDKPKATDSEPYKPKEEIKGDGALDDAKNKKKEAKTLLEELEAELEKAQDKFNIARLTADLFGVTLNAQQIDEVQAKIGRLKSFIAGENRAVEELGKLPGLTIQAASTQLEIYLAELDELNSKIDKTTDKNVIDQYIKEREVLQEKINKLNPIKIRSKTDREREIEEEREFWKQIEDIAVNAAQTIKDSVSTALSNEIEYTDRNIDLQEKRVDKAEELAEKGKVRQLEIEEDRLQKLNQKRAEYVKAQQAISSAEILQSNAVAAANSIQAITAGFKAGGAAGIFQGIATGFALAAQIYAIQSTLKNAFADIPGFFLGSERISRHFQKNKVSDGRDGYVFRGDGTERMVPGPINDQLGDIPNAKLPEAVKIWRFFPGFVRSVSSWQGKGTYDSRRVEEKLDRLSEAVEGLGIDISLDSDGFHAGIQQRIQGVERRKWMMA